MLFGHFKRKCHLSQHQFIVLLEKKGEINVFNRPADVATAGKNASHEWYFSYMWTQKPFYHTVVQNTSPPVCSCTSAAALSKQTSVGEPKSAEGLQVLVSGSAVPALLRTGEDGAAPAEGSGTLEVCRRMPCLWSRAHVELQLRRSSYKSWTWGATEVGKRWKNWDLQILRWKEIIEGMTCFPFFGGPYVFKKDCDRSRHCNARFLMPISLLRRSMRTDLNVWQALSHGMYSKCDCNCGATAEHTFNTLHWVYCINWVP